MQNKKFALRLTEKQYDNIIEFSKQVGISRNAVISMCIHNFFKQQDAQAHKEVKEDTKRLVTLKQSILNAKK